MAKQPKASSATIDPPSDDAPILFLPLSTLRNWDDNYHRGNVDRVVSSFVEFGFRGALRVWSDNIIIAGNTSLVGLNVMKAQGLAKPAGPIRVDPATGDWLIPCIDCRDFTRVRATAFAIADNHTAELGENDDQQLAKLLQQINAEDATLLDATGYDAEALQSLLDASDGEDDSPSDTSGDDEAGEKALNRADELLLKWGVKRGDLWLMPAANGKGTHRLKCGDSTVDKDVQDLMRGEVAACMWTDPPYGISYVGKTEDALTIENDGSEGLEKLINAALRLANTALAAGAPFYIAHPAGPLSLVFGQAVITVGWRWHQTLMWLKDSMVLGHSDYHYKHEPILYGYTRQEEGTGRRGRGHEGWYGDNAQVSVLEFARPKASELHPTMKPLDLIVYCLDNSSKKRDLIYDPFLGSGSTMLASDRIGRICNGLELDPKYCSVILERMAETGITPQRVER